MFTFRTSHKRTSYFFFFNDTATTEIYTLSLHDALPISVQPYWSARTKHLATSVHLANRAIFKAAEKNPDHRGDRKSTRLNSSHVRISYAVFCLKKKKEGHPLRYHESTTYGSTLAPISDC